MTGLYYDVRDIGALGDFVSGAVGSSFSWHESLVGDGEFFGYSNSSFPVLKKHDLVLSVSFYDFYEFLSFDGWGDSFSFSKYPYDASALPAVRGQMVGSMVRVLNSAGSGVWLRSVSYFDDFYRVIQSVSSNHLGGIDRVSSSFDFSGRLLSSRSLHSVPDRSQYIAPPH